MKRAQPQQWEEERMSLETCASRLSIFTDSAKALVLKEEKDSEEAPLHYLTANLREMDAKVEALSSNGNNGGMQQLEPMLCLKWFVDAYPPISAQCLVAYNVVWML